MADGKNNVLDLEVIPETKEALIAFLSEIKEDIYRATLIIEFLRKKNNAISVEDLIALLSQVEKDNNKKNIICEVLKNTNKAISVEDLETLLSQVKEVPDKTDILYTFLKNTNNAISVEDLSELLFKKENNFNRGYIVCAFANHIKDTISIEDVKMLLSKVETGVYGAQMIYDFLKNTNKAVSIEDFKTLLSQVKEDTDRIRIISAFIKKNAISLEDLETLLSQVKEGSNKKDIICAFIEKNAISLEDFKTLLSQVKEGSNKKDIICAFIEKRKNTISIKDLETLLSLIENAYKEDIIVIFIKNNPSKENLDTLITSKNLSPITKYEIILISFEQSFKVEKNNILYEEQIVQYIQKIAFTKEWDQLQLLGNANLEIAESISKKLLAQLKNKKVSSNIPLYTGRLKKKPFIDKSATADNDHILKNFYNQKQGLLVSVQQKMTPNWTLKTAKNYHNNKKEVRSGEEPIPFNKIEPLLLQLYETPPYNTECKKSLLHGSLIVEGRKLSFFESGFCKGIIFNDILMCRIFHSYENASVNYTGILNNFLPSVGSLNNQQYFEAIKSDPELEKNHNEIVFVSHYNAALSDEQNAALNILGYFLVLPIDSANNNDFKQMFLDKKFNRTNGLYERHELEVLLEEIAQSKFPLYAHDNTTGKLYKLNKDAVMLAIYEARKEQLSKDTIALDRLDCLFYHSLEELNECALTPAKAPKLPVTTNIQVYGNPDGTFSYKETGIIFNLLKRFTDYISERFSDYIFGSTPQPEVTPVKPDLTSSPEKPLPFLEDYAKEVLSKMGLAEVEAVVLATRIGRREKSKEIYKALQENTILKDFFKNISNEDILQAVQEVFPENVYFYTPIAEYRNRLISKLERLKEHFEPKKDLEQGQVSFFKNSQVENSELNHISFTTCTNIKETEVYNKTYNFKEPDEKPGMRVGVVVMEEDGRCWMHYPKDKNHKKQGYYSKVVEFTRGGREEGESLHQAAIKEAWEEMGLMVDLTAHLTDIHDGQDYVRYYSAKRVGGNPTAWDKVNNETSAVKLIPVEKLETYFKRFNHVSLPVLGFSDLKVLQQLNKQLLAKKTQENDTPIETAFSPKL